MTANLRGYKVERMRIKIASRDIPQGKKRRLQSLYTRGVNIAFSEVRTWGELSTALYY